MKRLLFFFLGLFIAVYTVNAQVVFEYDFETSVSPFFVSNGAPVLSDVSPHGGLKSVYFAPALGTYSSKWPMLVEKTFYHFSFWIKTSNPGELKLSYMPTDAYATFPNGKVTANSSYEINLRDKITFSSSNWVLVSFDLYSGTASLSNNFSGAGNIVIGWWGNGSYFDDWKLEKFDPNVSAQSITVKSANNINSVPLNLVNLQMQATFVPENTTNKEVEWTVTNGTGSATISTTGLLTAQSVGTVTVKAAAKDGSGVFGTCDVEITAPITLVNSIVVTGSNGATTIETNKGTLQMISTVLPADAFDKTITWSVADGTGKAIISANGLLTAKGNGTVTVKATANDGSKVIGELVVTISNQIIPKTYKVVPLGDSKTEGAFNAGTQHSWRGYLRAKLIENDYSIDYLGSQQQRAHGDVMPYDNDHCGYGGYTVGPDTYTWCPTCPTIGIYEHIETWLNRAGDPDIIILSAGVNDMLGKDSDHPANFKATLPQRYADLVNKIFQLRPNVKLIVCTIEPVRWDKNWTGLNTINAAIRTLANQSATDNIFLADLYTDFMATWNYADFYDDVHMAQQGATKTANTIYNALIPLMQNSTVSDVRSVSQDQNLVTVFPNPVRGNQQLNVRVEDFKLPVEAKLFNMTGGLVYYNSKIDNNNFNILKPNLQEGMYLLKVTDGEKSISKKVIVN